jgi:hypothetical protein
MSSFLRLACFWMCNLQLALLPEKRKGWARAIRAEVENIPDDSAAFHFALDAVRGVGLVALAAAFQSLWAFFKPPSLTAVLMGGIMIKPASTDVKMRIIGIACAIGATGLGILYLMAAGAPVRMLLVNGGALILGLTMLIAFLRLPAVPPLARDVLTLFLSCALLFTAISGTAVEGASRWMRLGPVAVQPSLILLPVIIMVFARSRSALSTAGVLISALSMALQPDRAMAGVLVCGMISIAIARRDQFSIIALAASIAAFIATLIVPDQLPSVPYVDQILYTAFDVHVLAGLAVVGGAGLLLVPALFGLRTTSLDRSVYATFGVIWLSITMAAAIGNYPTPVVGYGASAILGYLFSVGTLLLATTQSVVLDSGRQETSRSSPGFNSPFRQHQPA